MDVKKPIYCALAFGSASINSYGEYIPCCNIRTDYWKMFKDGHYDHGIVGKDPEIRINAHNLKDLRRQLINGEWPQACTNCKDAEDNGIGSMRTIWNAGLAPAIIPIVEIVDPKDIKYLDLTFGTKCNSKCMTCSSDLSDFWEEEWESVWRIQPEQKRNLKRVSIDDITAQKLVDNFPNVEAISFIGGEPTISDEHVEFLKLLIATGRNRQIRLSYVTNLTGMSDELLNMWKQFGKVHVSVSIDGYQKVNEYIRYPFKWKKVEANLRTYVAAVQTSIEQYGHDHAKTQFSIGLSCTISMFNAVQCMDLFEFWYNMLLEYKKFDGTLAHDAGCFVNRVSHPQYALLGLLTPAYRKTGIEKGQRLLDTIATYLKNNPTEGINNGFIESIKITMSWLAEPHLVNSTFLAQSKHFITESDAFRNRHLKYYIPELWNELETIWSHGIIPDDFYIYGKVQHHVANELIDGPGYVITEKIIPDELIDALTSKLHMLHPVRASSSNKVYAEGSAIKDLPNIAVWWSQLVMDWPEVKAIEEIVSTYVKKYIPAAIFYNSDIVVIEGNTDWFNPHIDTPHRFSKWNLDKRFLGVQTVVPLFNIDKTSASTGLVPHSQKLNFDINECYAGEHNEWFWQNHIQPDLPKGCVLLFNSRLLHSSMPNPLETSRPALLLNYLDSSIIDEVKAIDNIWKSNE